MNTLSFSSFNKKFESDGESCTGFEWLSRDEQEVKKYVDDPDCGFVCTASFFYDFIRGMLSATSRKSAQNVRKDLPMFFISGSEDPVGDFGEGVIKAVNLYRKADVQTVEYKLYEGARHELTNELCKKEVFEDVLKFIKDQCEK